MYEKKLSAKLVSLVIVLVLICFIAGAGSAAYIISYSQSDSSSDTSNISASQVARTSENSSRNISHTPLSGSQIYSLALKQVVAITSTGTTTNAFGQTTTNAASGSGFIISESGYIMTNYHVIEYSVLYGYELSVVFSDGTSYKADIIGYYPDNDIAIIKIDISGLSSVSFGSSKEMQVGDTIYCVGNPLGELSFTLTGGIVSALDRMITTDASTSINMFQLDAAVNSGNSGGPVYNSYGQVIGIVTAKYSDEGVEGLGFAIPINDASTIASELIKNGYVSGKAYLGITAIDVESYVSSYYSIPKGAYVYSVSKDSCAEIAGIRAGDVITSIDNTEISGMETLKTTLSGYASGDNASIKIFRSGEYFTLQVTLDEKMPEISSNVS